MFLIRHLEKLNSKYCEQLPLYYIHDEEDRASASANHEINMSNSNLDSGAGQQKPHRTEGDGKRTHIRRANVDITSVTNTTPPAIFSFLQQLVHLAQNKKPGRHEHSNTNNS